MVLSPSLLSRTRKLEYLLKVHLISCSNLSSFMRPLISDQKPTQIGFSITHVIFSHFSQGSFSDDSTAPQISRRKRKCQARLKSMIYFTSCRLSRTLRTEPDVTGTVSWEVTNGFTTETKKSTTENPKETKQTSWQGWMRITGMTFVKNINKSAFELSLKWMKLRRVELKVAYFSRGLNNLSFFNQDFLYEYC